MFNVILLEDGIIWPQTGNSSCPGATDYVHKHLVRAMMNGALGQEVVNGTWNQNEVISKSINYTVPTPTTAVPDMVWDSCNVVVMVYKNTPPLASASEIQQAVEMTLISPDYVAAITSASNDVIADKYGTVNFTVEIENQGLLDDSYYVDIEMVAPNGWTGEYTTVNGTFPFGQQDLIDVATGESAVVNLEVLPNAINGYGEITVEFTSMNEPSVTVSCQLRTVTTTGVEMLIVDASEEDYGSMVTNSLDNVFTGTYGMVSRTALTPGINLNNFYEIIWSAGVAVPAFYPDEVTALESFLDDGGRLLINGQDIGADIFEPSGQSQFAQSFYNNYLHAEYVADNGFVYLLNGYDGDPITDGLQFILSDIYDRLPDEIMPYDADATAIFKFLNGPKISSIRAESGDYRVVYFGFGFEQVGDQAMRDTLLSRSIQWLKEGIVVSSPQDLKIARTFALEQNYPNPFNPATTINYSLEKDVQVSLKVFDIMGSEVAELVNSKQSAGVHTVQFDASSLASGMYFYRLSAGDFVSIKKMTLLK
jgi:hypothetical protein